MSDSKFGVDSLQTFPKMRSLQRHRSQLILELVGRKISVGDEFNDSIFLALKLLELPLQVTLERG